jgi:hypothetical protein
MLRSKPLRPCRPVLTLRYEIHLPSAMASPRNTRNQCRRVKRKSTVARCTSDLSEPPIIIGTSPSEIRSRREASRRPTRGLKIAGSGVKIARKKTLAASVRLYPYCPFMLILDEAIKS